MEREYEVKTDLARKAAEYFRQEPGLHRMMHAFIEKYRSHGRFGGTAVLANLKTEEKEALSGFFRKDYSGNKSTSLSANRFEKALNETKFAGADVEALLGFFAGEPLVSKKEEKKSFEEEKQAFFEKKKLDFPHRNCLLWLEHIIAKGAGTRQLHHLYEYDKGLLDEIVANVCRALAALPSGSEERETQYIRLPVFAQKCTKDPHGFDYGKEQGKAFISALHCLKYSQEGKPVYQMRNWSSEKVTELMDEFGIIRDDLQNFVTCTGLAAFQGDRPLPVWEAALAEGSVLNVPLREVAKISSCAAGGFWAGKGSNTVFVVENSGVYSAILDYFSEGDYPSLICTHGQFKLAALMLIDKLAESGASIYYSGDFDPEGLQMAQRLYKRHPRNVKLWRYTKEDYLKCRSVLELSGNRLGQLNGITLRNLYELKEAMLDRKAQAFQEEFIDELVADIKLVSG